MYNKEDLLRLWIDAFGKQEKDFAEFFIDFFFSNHVYKPEDVITLYDSGNNELISALYLLPYTFKILGTEFQAGYIYAAATDSRHRGKGHMSELMNMALAECGRRGYSYALIVPAEPSLFDYYARFGFVTAFYLEETHIADVEILNNNKNNLYIKSACSEDIETVYELYIKHMGDNTCKLSKKQILFNLLDGGLNTYILYKESTALGCAFVRKNNTDNICNTIEEIICPDEYIKSFSAELGIYKIKHRPAAEGIGRPFGMVRVIDSTLVLSDLFKQKNRPYMNMMMN